MPHTRHPPKQPKLGAVAATTTTTDGSRIPTDIIAEILFRLPPSDIQNCTSVCKGWLETISNPDFNRRYRSKLYCNKTRILAPWCWEIVDYNFTTRSTKEIRYPKGFCMENTIIAGSCDGLVCLLDRWNCNFVLFNRKTEAAEIGRVDRLYSHLSFFHWFGHHPYTGEHVLVVGKFLFKTNTFAIEVHSLCSKLKNKACSSVVRAPPVPSEERATPLRGNLHWLARVYGDEKGEGVNGVILGYDFDKNKVLKFCAPGDGDFRLGVFDGCLLAIKKAVTEFEMWVMKEYGVKESWTKSGKIEGFRRCRDLTPLGFLPNGEIILHGNGNDGDGSIVTNYSFTSEEKGMDFVEIRTSRLASKAILCGDA